MMRRTGMIIGVLASSLTMAYGAPPQFKCDFSGGIPPEVILIDGDGNTPATAMANIGFAVGVPWIGYFVEDEDEYVACSTSWYKPAGTSDDWMILPTVTVSEGATLKWRARSSDKKYFDGYAVYISTDGSSRDAFDISAPVFATDGESNQWTAYEIDLAAYAGKDINVAFVNNSTNKARLYIDDVKVGTNYPLMVNLDTPALVRDSADGSDLIVSGNVITEFADVSIIGDVTLEHSGETIAIAASDLAEGAHFSFGKSVHLDAGQEAVIEVKCTSAGGFSYTATITARSTFRPVVVEEFTGTWCSWCIRGIVYLEAMKEVYGDMLIPLCVHEDDVMETPEYFRGVDYLHEQSIPDAIVNRKYECDPTLLGHYGAQALDEDIHATITAATIDYDAGAGVVGTDVAVAFSRSVSDGAYRLAYVLVEDNVCVPDDPRYCQENAYSGGVAGEMGGYENKPRVIAPADMTYHDVVRYVSDGGPHGVAMSLPGIVSAGVEYHHVNQIEVPATVLNPAELYLVVLVLDSKSNEVLNGRRYKMSDYDSVIDIIADNCGDNGIDVYTVSGIKVGHYPSRAAFVSQSPGAGLYIINDGVKAAKLLVR